MKIYKNILQLENIMENEEFDASSNIEWNCLVQSKKYYIFL